ncbi:hypothetical protein F4553_000567 [Allocatelliglobosispora scoriae]|uniref:DUF4240 domain-containing protein n=1 Tax=Allocatelliglobosispora scoriae TaxID=643052 RepID=A0A841BIN7_9ACTN|nr:DUF4240 domain-containing protein [Allocatelliglobosispora scoriae]MBB5867188.1 hypothetical protein [Allocatelliglobosispora scoriae]
MQESGFWDVIDDAYASLECGYYDEDHPGAAVAQAWLDGLAGLPPAEVLDFAVHFEAALERAWRPEVWAAACLLTGGTPDDIHAAFGYEDRFLDFRASLVALGSASFGTVVADPDALADLPDLEAVERGDWDLFMKLDGVAEDAYAQAGGGVLASVLAGRLGGPPHRGAPADETWWVPDSVSRQRFPRLAARFPHGMP